MLAANAILNAMADNVSIYHQDMGEVMMLAQQQMVDQVVNQVGGFKNLLTLYPGTLKPWNPETLKPWNPGTLEP